MRCSSSTCNDSMPGVLSECRTATPGASFHPELDVTRIDHIVHKGTDVRVDSYSAFFDNARGRDTGLAAWCEARSIDEIVVLGLATDYCVKYTVLDALELGLTVCVVPQGCRAVDIMAGDGERALVKMETAGATMRTLHDLLDRQ